MVSNNFELGTSSQSRQLSPKLNKIVEWLIRNADYFESSHFTKIVINLKNDSIVGEINIFPDHKV